MPAQRDVFFNSQLYKTDGVPLSAEKFDCGVLPCMLVTFRDRQRIAGMLSIQRGRRFYILRGCRRDKDVFNFDRRFLIDRDTKRVRSGRLCS